MGARTWMLVYADGPVENVLTSYPRLDSNATDRFAQKLFPKDKLEYLDDCYLWELCPEAGELMAGSFPGITFVAATEFGIDYPSQLPRLFIDAGRDGFVYLHAMHNVVDWFAYAIWTKGTLVRSLSLSPDSGILEDIGQKQPFETPFWSGQYPATDDEEEEYPFPFHPLELGEAALHNLFGFVLEGYAGIGNGAFDIEKIMLRRYKRSRRVWGFGNWFG